VRKYNYLGKPTIALFMKSATSQVKAKIKSMKLQEQIQAESYQATVSHELRTPILSVVFLLQQIILVLATRSPSAAIVEQACKHAKIIQGQLKLMESHVEDLLSST